MGDQKGPGSLENSSGDRIVVGGRSIMMNNVKRLSTKPKQKTGVFCFVLVKNIECPMWNSLSAISSGAIEAGAQCGISPIIEHLLETARLARWLNDRLLRCMTRVRSPYRANICMAYR